MSARARLAAALAAALAGAGCVSGDYNVDRAYVPLADAAVDALRPGASDLREVLARLGAPLDVVELEGGLALAWGWLDERNWNVDVQVPLDQGSFDFRFQSTRSALPGIVVFLDEADVVVRVQRGVLADLLPSDKPPLTLDQLEEPRS